MPAVWRTTSSFCGGTCARFVSPSIMSDNILRYITVPYSYTHSIECGIRTLAVIEATTAPLTLHSFSSSLFKFVVRSRRTRYKSCMVNVFNSISCGIQGCSSSVVLGLHPVAFEGWSVILAIIIIVVLVITTMLTISIAPTIPLIMVVVLLFCYGSFQISAG